MINRLQTQLIGWISMVMVSVLSSNAWAQTEGLKPPKTTDAPSSPKYLMMGIILLLVGATVFVVTLKTKRNHQD